MDSAAVWVLSLIGWVIALLLALWFRAPTQPRGGIEL